MTSRSRSLLAPALFLTFFAAAFTFGPDGISWFWARQPGVAIALAVGAVGLWILLAASVRQAHRA